MAVDCISYVRRLDASDDDDAGPINKLAFEVVLTSSLHDGDLVLCTAGERIPLDGVVVEGRASIDDENSAEEWVASPILTAAGLRVLRGTLLESGYVIVRVALESRRQEDRAVE